MRTKSRGALDARPDLIRILVDHGVNEHDVRMFLWLLQVPEKLHRVVYVCDRIQQSISVVRAHVHAEPHLSMLAGVETICNAVVTAREELVRKIGSHVDWMPGKDIPGQNPLYGLCLTKNPTWGALAADCSDASLNEEFRVMQYHLIVLQLWISLRYSSFSAYENNPEEISVCLSRDLVAPAANAVRHMSLPGTNDEYDLAFFNPFRTSYELAINLEKPVLDHRTPYATAFQGVARRLLGLGKPRGERPEGSGKRGKTRPIGDYSAGAPGKDVSIYGEDLDSSGCDVAVITLRRLGGTKLSDQHCRDLEGLGLIADEFSGDDGLVISAVHGTIDSTSSIKRHAGAAALRNIARVNQWLPHGAKSLTAYEISTLRAYLEREISLQFSSKQVSREQTVEYLALCTIAASLVTGRTFQQIVQVRQWGEATRPPGSLCIVCYQDGGVSWVDRAISPAYKTYPEEPRALVRPRASHVVLPDISGAADPFLRYAESNVQEGQSRIIHHAMARSVAKKARGLLADFNKQFCVNVSETGVRNALLIKALNITNHTISMYLTGRYMPGENARLHYGVYTHDEIRSAYCEAVLGLCRNQDGTDDEKIVKRAGEIARFPDLFIGARLCATQESATEAIGRIVGELDAIRIRESTSKFARYHNLYTLYSMLVLFYSTAYRAVNKVSPRLPRVTGNTKLLVFDDKGVGGSGYRRRIVPLMEILARQSEHYRLHLRALSSGESSFLRAASEDRFFFLTPNGDRIDNRMLRFSEHLKEFLPLPPNQHRGYLKTELHRAGCPGTVIDWFLGHWAYGQSPYDAHSTMQADQYATVLRAHLEQVHRALGLVPIRSKLVRQS